MSIKQIQVRMEFAELPVDIMLDVTTKDELVADIDLLYGLGFTKPKRYFKEQLDIKDQAAVVKAVTLSTRKTNAGKPMYEVVVQTEAGDKHTVLKLNKSEFRAEDEVWLFKNEKGYLDIQLDFPPAEPGKEVPF